MSVCERERESHTPFGSKPHQQRGREGVCLWMRERDRVIHIEGVSLINEEEERVCLCVCERDRVIHLEGGSLVSEEEERVCV